MNEKFVPVVSMSSHTVEFNAPEYHYSRTWPKKGAKLMIDRDILANSIYRPGVERLFTEGFLYIADEAFRKEIGLEYGAEEGDQGSDTSKKLVMLDDKMLNRIIKLMPLSEVSLTIQKLSQDQKLELVDYAVNHYTDLKMDRVELLSKECGIDVFKSIEFKKALEV